MVNVISRQKLDLHFTNIRRNIVGNNFIINTPYGAKNLHYADWIASGRLYRPIERKMLEFFGPMVANTHTEASDTGIFMTATYHKALNLIKEHVNASKTDAIITFGSGMTGVINKFQRILGLKYCGQVTHKDCIKNNEKPVVFITHMEHHSNHTSWLETYADVVVIPPGKDLLIDLSHLENELKEYRYRKVKIGSFTACSNVTGIETPYYKMAELMHKYGGVCFVDFAASAPYVAIDMHPINPKQNLDAIFFSPHKFLGGPGTSGVLIFDSKLYHSTIPDNPGGGTVDWTNPWGGHKYIDDIEAREDGGTPGFLQAIRTALCIELKNQMGIENLRKREEELVKTTFRALDKIEGLHILAKDSRKRLGIISFYIDDLHYNLAVRLLNDYFGVQVRGGCACAGTYGHYLLNVSFEDSRKITTKITSGDLSEKPGWVRLSLHPSMSNKQLFYILNAIKEVVENKNEWRKNYVYNPKTNEFKHNSFVSMENKIANAFKL